MEKNSYKDAYVTEQVPSRLRPYIRRFMVVNHKTSISETVHPKPTGYSYLNWVIQGHWQAEYGSTIFSSKKHPVFFTGQIRDEAIVVTQAECFQHIVTEFTALGFYQITGIKGIDCRNRARAPEFFSLQLQQQFNHLLAKAQRISQPASLSDYLTLLGELFAHLSETPHAVPDYLVHGVAQFEQDHGRVQVAKVCQNLDISERQFSRCFTEIVGLSPKYFSRVLQMNKALSALLEGDRGYLINIANAAGYFDESHFIRVIQEFFKNSPQRFLNSHQETLFSFLGKSRNFS